MRDFRLNGGFPKKKHVISLKWVNSMEKTRDFRVKWGICEEKTCDFRLNGGFANRKRVIFASVGDSRTENGRFSLQWCFTE
ncbi:Uncharacterised protein [Chlamydia abortus]|nr:Uncharacterised protein [Chlamydia abortus]